MTGPPNRNWWLSARGRDRNVWGGWRRIAGRIGAKGGGLLNDPLPIADDDAAALREDNEDGTMMTDQPTPVLRHNNQPAFQALGGHITLSRYLLN